MTSRLKLLPCLLALVAVAVTPAAAQAKYRVGFGEQQPSVFDNHAWQKAKLKRARLYVSWDYAKVPWQAAQVADWMNRAHAAHQDVLIAFSAPSGCWTGKRYRKKHSCKAPSVKKYRRVFRKFDKQYPWVRTYSAWNEINHKSQPTYKHPKKAAKYYNALRKDCRKRHCRVMAADLLDTSNMLRYLRKFKRHVKGHPKLWGLHNYQDVNHHTSHDTRALLRHVKGEVWLTETGGIVSFGKNWKYSKRRAKKATRWMFKLANRYDHHRKGNAKLGRLYVYNWIGRKRGHDFDAGLVGPTGKPRPAYKVFKKNARRHR